MRGSIRLQQEFVGLNGLGDVFGLMLTNISKFQRQVAIHLLKDISRDADTPGLRERLQARCDIDSVAVDRAVLVGNDVPEVESDAKLHAPVLSKLAVAACELSLDVGRTLDGFHRAVEYGQHTVARSIDHTSLVLDDVLSEDLAVFGEGALCGLLVVAHQPRVTGCVGGQDAGELALAGHFEGPRATSKASVGSKTMH